MSALMASAGLGVLPAIQPAMSESLTEPPR